VRFIVIGGVAMRLQGSAHVTDDIDISYARDPDNLKLLADALAAYHPRLRGVPDDLPFLWDAQTLRQGQNFTLQTDIGDIDILGEVAGADAFEKLWERSTEMDLEGVPVRVASVDDLIAMKRAANRPKDQLHLMELEALRKLLQDEQTK
jgi:hypothetical protein